MPAIVEKHPATRSNNFQWSGMCIKTPLDSDVPEDQLEVLLGFNGSNTQGHYVPICKSTIYSYTHNYTLYTHTIIHFYTLILHLIIQSIVNLINSIPNSCPFFMSLWTSEILPFMYFLLVLLWLFLQLASYKHHILSAKEIGKSLLLGCPETSPFQQSIQAAQDTLYYINYVSRFTHPFNGHAFLVHRVSFFSGVPEHVTPSKIRRIVPTSTTTRA